LWNIVAALSMGLQYHCGWQRNGHRLLETRPTESNWIVNGAEDADTLETVRALLR
jgi:hypothetical protein